MNVPVGIVSFSKPR